MAVVMRKPLEEAWKRFWVLVEAMEHPVLVEIVCRVAGTVAEKQILKRC